MKLPATTGWWEISDKGNEWSCYNNINPSFLDVIIFIIRLLLCVYIYICYILSCKNAQPCFINDKKKQMHNLLFSQYVWTWLVLVTTFILFHYTLLFKLQLRGSSETPLRQRGQIKLKLFDHATVQHPSQLPFLAIMQLLTSVTSS